MTIRRSVRLVTYRRHLCRLGDIAFEIGGKTVGRRRRRLHADVADSPCDLGVFERGNGSRVELGYNIARRSPWGHDTEPSGELEVIEAQFGEGRDIRKH